MTKPALIDCRAFDDYCAGHIGGACSLPADQLFERMHELPKRDRALSLCGNEQELEVAASYLIERGHSVVEKIIWSQSLAEQLRIDGCLETGSFSQQLWKPAPLWQRFAEEIAPINQIKPGRGLDIACGAGRDLVYLAMQGWQMTGIDRSEDSLQRVAILAEQMGVSVTNMKQLSPLAWQSSTATINTLQGDLESGVDPFTDFADASFDLITVGRYLHRPLFPFIRRLLKSGGVVLYQTFMQGCEKTEIGRPRNPNFLLKPNELAGHFADFEILVDDVETLEDGRPVAAFIARKVSDRAVTRNQEAALSA